MRVVKKERVTIDRAFGKWEIYLNIKEAEGEEKLNLMAQKRIV